MAFWNQFDLFKKIKIDNLYQELVNKSKLDFEFVFQSFAGLATCVLGLSINSIPIIIGSMIISPIIYALLVLPAAIVWRDKKMFLRSLINLLAQIFIGVAICFVLSFIFNVNVVQINLINKMEENTMIYFLVALVAGASAALSFFGPEVSAKLTGVAVSVALVPPIAIIGIALDNFSLPVFINTILYLFLNLIGIIIGAFFIFTMVKKHQAVNFD